MMTRQATTRALLLLLLLSFVVPSRAVLDENSWNPGTVSSIGDPAVLKDGENYYLYTTSVIFQNSADMGIRSWKSTDLRHWQSVSWAFFKSSTTWGQSHFWAPDVVKGNDGSYYMFYSASPRNVFHLAICIARSASPTGPFTEFKAPFIQSSAHEFDPMIFKDDDGRYYLYWTSSTQGLLAQEISSDFTALFGAPVQVLNPLPDNWNAGNEAPYVIKRNSVYYLMYSGGAYAGPDYAVGYGTSSSPLGPFTKYAGNPILKKDMTPGARISGPGTNAVATAPDGTLKIVYNAHTDPDKPSGDRTVYVDNLGVTQAGELFVIPTRRAEPDDTLTSGIEPGWALLGQNNPGLAWPSYDEATGHFRANVEADPAARTRIAGLMTNRPNWLPYSSVGSDNYVRAKFYVYTGGQTNPADTNEIPNVKLRVSNRFAVSAMLELMHHQSVDPGNQPYAGELRPSTDPANPSLYRVDFDPVDVPYLATSTTNEGISRGFEAYCFEPQENGYIALAESHIEAYPRALLPDSNDPSTLMQVFAPTATDAGSLHLANPQSEMKNVNWTNPTYEGDTAQDDPSNSPMAIHTEGPFGVTVDSTNVEEYAVAFMQRDFYPGANQAARPRVQPAKQYKARFHVTSTQFTDRQAWVSMRSRTIKFGWVYQLLLTGTYTTNGIPNQTITKQALPGIGNLNPDKIGNENGGWYTVHMHTPLSPDIRAEAPEGTPLEQMMPLLTSLPGPGSSSVSRRDIRLGIQLMDSPGLGANQKLEKGNFTVDRIELRQYDLLPD